MRGGAPGAAGRVLAALLGPPGTGLRAARLGLGCALIVLAVWLLGPLRPWALPGTPTLVPREGQSHIHTVLVATGWAAALNAALCALLLATSGLWARPLRSVGRNRPRVPLGRRAWVLLAAAAALAGVLRWPLAHGSVWWDEAWSLRNVIVGKRDPAPDDPQRYTFEPASWRRTLWYYHAPTNHVAFSVAARLSTDAWRKLRGAEPWEFDELAFRLPAFAAALVAVVLLGLLVAELGFPGAAPAAAFLLAIHPLHVRYGTDGRGYSFVVLLTVAGAWLLLRALRDPRWRWWLAYGGSQALLLWSFPLAIYVPLALGLAGAAEIGLGGSAGVSERALRLARLAVANLLAAMVFLQLMAPNLAQAAAFEKEWHDVGGLTASWLRYFWVMISTGLQARGPRLHDVEFPTLANLARSCAYLRFVVYAALPALAVLGLVRSLRRGDGTQRAVWIGLLGATLLFLLHRELQAFFVLPRFVIFALPLVVALLAVGFEGLLSALASAAGLRRSAVAAGLALGLAGFAALVAPALRVLLTRPATPSREVVALLARAGEGVPGGVLRAGIGLGGDAPRVYDPGIVEVEGLRQLEALCERSRAEARPLYVFYAYGTLNAKRLPDLFIRIRDPLLFEDVARLDGIDGDLVIRVHRYLGRPLD
jgi:hypothetical protein